MILWLHIKSIGLVDKALYVTYATLYIAESLSSTFSRSVIRHLVNYVRRQQHSKSATIAMKWTDYV